MLRDEVIPPLMYIWKRQHDLMCEVLKEGTQYWGKELFQEAIRMYMNNVHPFKKN